MEIPRPQRSSVSERVRYVSLFSGSGGLDLGLERAGFDPLWFCEKDKSCRKVLAERWPEVRVFEDVTTLTEAGLSEAGFGGDASGSPDVLVGGFP